MRMMQATREGRTRSALWPFMLLPLLLATMGCAPRPYWNTPTVVVPSATPILVTVAPTPLPTVEPTATPVISGPTTLRTDPQVALDLAVGETRLVQIRLENVEGLHGIELHVSFEPRYVSIEDADASTDGIQAGTGTIPAPAQVVRNEVDNGAGLVVYHVSQAPDSPPAMGGGLVASLTVRGRAEGGSPLRFNVVRLFGADGQLLAAPAQIDGLVAVGAGGATPQPAAGEATAMPGVETSQSGEPTFTPLPATPAAGQAVTHTVQPGENLFRIAQKYNVTVEALMGANGLSDPDTLSAGQVLVIPAGATTGAVTYVVQRGDTLFSIATRHETTVDALVALNGLSSADAIYVGQSLIIHP